MSRPVARGGAQRIPRPPTARPGRPAPWAHLPPDERHLDVARVRAALDAGPPPRRSPLERATHRSSSVLAALYDDPDTGGASVLLTRRPWHMRSHSGEVSFPGGRREPGDADLVATALREAHEEIGLDPSTVDVVGELDHLVTMWSGSSITPYVGALPGPPDGLRPNPAEVDHILRVPLAELLLDEVFSEERWPMPGGGGDRPLWFFALHGDTVWGATAAMLRDLLARALGLEVEPPQEWGAQPSTGNEE
jgi:8-oxo-dGTP pyrophosphatase MutT (NUDIX family)